MRRWELFFREAWKWCRDPLGIRARRQKKAFLEEFRKPTIRDPRWPGFTPSKKWRPYGEDLLAYYQERRDLIPCGGLSIVRSGEGLLDDLRSGVRPPAGWPISGQFVNPSRNDLDPLPARHGIPQ